MATAISNIPILTADVAEDFVARAICVEQNSGSSTFTHTRAEWSDFEDLNRQRIAQLKNSGQWPF